MSVAAIALIALGVVLVLLALLALLSRAAHARFFSTVILGADNRTSTSKTFVFMWTLLVAWALIALLIAGEFVSRHSCVPLTDLTGAAVRCRLQGDETGLLQVGWLHFLHTGVSAQYLVLLGVPGAAAIAAKGITQSQVDDSGFKTTKAQTGPDPIGRITEIFNDDDGATDIGDLQYLIFNLVTATYFVAQFLNPDGTGLPVIPATLLGLTSVSAGLYVGKKAVSRNQPVVTGVFPLPLHDGQVFTVMGTYLTVDPTAPVDVEPQITIDGLSATLISAANGTLKAKAPPNLGASGTPLIRQLVVLNPYGGITSNFQVPCA
jgi:hypothetical protein